MKAPDLKQVIEYVHQSGSSTQLATAFFDRYQANGWTVVEPASTKNSWRTGRKPMKDWKKAISAFIRQQQKIQDNRVYRRAYRG